MVIIIPMAGLSSRFTAAGFTLPKYMLYIKDKSLFNLSVSSFSKYFANTQFVFIARDIFDTHRFIQSECKLMGIKDFKIVILKEPTRGQAETIMKGIESAHINPKEKILIFNIDTIRPNFTLPENTESWDGYLECFIGCGANWSYAKTEDGTDKTKVIETAEKKEISSFCSTGIYYFRETASFINAYNQSLEYNALGDIKEFYVAPLYNQLISKGKNIHVNIINKEEVIFCGVPQEYEEYLEKNVKSNKL